MKKSLVLESISFTGIILLIKRKKKERRKDRNTTSKIQDYLRKSRGKKTRKKEGRENKNDSADVTNNGEFLGVLFEDNEDGDTCYHFNMTILDIDLK